MKWTAYTDGACAPSNPGPAGWGAVLIAPDGATETDHYGFIGHGTNQIAELTAALEGLSRVPAGADVELVSDSQYVLKGLMEWRAGWERWYVPGAVAVHDYQRVVDRTLLSRRTWWHLRGMAQYVRRHPETLLRF